MSLDAGKEYVGQWWTPGAPENRVPGLLKIGDRGEPALQIFGWFSEPLVDGSDLSAASLPAVLGEVPHRSVTLWHVNLVSAEGDPRTTWGDSPSQSTQTFVAHQVLSAERHFPNPEEPCFTGANVALTHLDAWSFGKVNLEEDYSTFESVARLKGARLSVHGGAMHSHSIDSDSKRAQYALDIQLTAPASLAELYFAWERPFLGYLQVAVDDEVHLLRRTARVGNEVSDLVDVITNGTLPEEPTKSIRPWSLLMQVRDGRFESRMRRWFELDRLAAHGFVSLDMVFSGTNQWTNNRLMNVAAAFDSIGTALRVARADSAVVGRRREVAKAIASRADRDWFYSSTQHAARPSFSSVVRGLHAPVADATYPMLRDPDDWVQRLAAARNGIAHALADHIRVSRDPRYEHFLAQVSKAVLVARLMHELNYSEAQIRKLFVDNRALRFVGEQWWQLTHESKA